MDVKLPRIHILNDISILGRSAARVLLPLAFLVALGRLRKASKSAGMHELPDPYAGHSKLWMLKMLRS